MIAELSDLGRASEAPLLQSLSGVAARKFKILNVNAAGGSIELPRQSKLTRLRRFLIRVLGNSFLQASALRPQTFGSLLPYLASTNHPQALSRFGQQLLVCRTRNSQRYDALALALYRQKRVDGSEDVASGLGPFEWLGIGVVMSDEVHNVCAESLDATIEWWV